MTPELNWIENDIKVEQLASKMKQLRIHYLEKNPLANEEMIERYVSRKLKEESSQILNEQFRIISSSFKR